MNFLGVYDYVGFDANGLFISADYLTSTFTAEICEETAGMNLGDTEARIEIARNSLYKMMDDTSQADLLVQQVNNRLGSSGVTSTAMPITDSKLFGPASEHHARFDDGGYPYIRQRGYAGKYLRVLKTQPRFFAGR